MALLESCCHGTCTDNVCWQVVQSNVTVDVIDANDNAPTFDESVFHFAVDEEKGDASVGVVKVNELQCYIILFNIRGWYQS